MKIEGERKDVLCKWSLGIERENITPLTEHREKSGIGLFKQAAGR